MMPIEENKSQKKEILNDEPMILEEPNRKKLDSAYCSTALELSSLKASFSTKASPFLLKSWIAMVLTLDGRDKVTKAIQYASRLLAHYYETTGNSAKSLAATHLISKANRFRNLQAALTHSRKAYRFGRSFIEIEKLSSIGFGHWIAWHLRQRVWGFSFEVNTPLEDKLLQNNSGEDERQCDRKKAQCNDGKSERETCIPKQEGKITWHDDTNFDQGKDDLRIQAHDNNPPQMKLPRRVSSNLFPTTIVPSIKQGAPRSYRQLSSIGRFVYLSLSSYINEEKAETTPPPLWKVFSSVGKLLGLAGFWAADNISFLYSSGFLIDGAKITQQGRSRAKEVSIFAARSYFFAAVSGLYLNLRELIHHRNGPLKEAWIGLEHYSSNVKVEGDNGAYEEHESSREMDSFKAELEKAKRKHGILCMALLKVSAFINTTISTLCSIALLHNEDSHLIRANCFDRVVVM
jgi:hypothetical protein